MKTLLLILLLSGAYVNAGTAILCHQDGTCEIVITQE